MTVQVPLFVNGGGMRGGNVHYSIEGLPFLGEASTAPRYRFFSVRDEFPGLWPVDEGGVSIPGELYEVPLDVIRDRFIPAEPPELELSVIELDDGSSARGRAPARGRARGRDRPDRHLRARRLARLPRQPAATGGLSVMAEFDLVIRAPRVITRVGEVSRCVGVRDGVVVAIEPLEAELTGDETVELADDEVLLPGLVDTHVHVNEPGRTEWEGFATATRAAAAGGVTTLLDMPLNSLPPTCTVEALEVKKRGRPRDKCHVDVGFWGGAIPGNIDDLRGLHDAGVFGFKCFMADSGCRRVPAAGRRRAGEVPGGAEHLRGDDDRARRGRGRDRARPARCRAGKLRHFLASRPRGSENLAIANLIEAARNTGARVHLLHLSSSDAVPMIRTRAPGRHPADRRDLPALPGLRGPVDRRTATRQFKCCPPIREADNREELWARAGPRRHRLHRVRPLPVHARAQAAGHRRVRPAWGGISSLQLGLSAVWTEARQRGYTLVDVVRWMAERPAQIARLQRKGQIERGYHADFAVFAPDDAFVVDPHRLHHRNRVTPYAYRPLAGVVRSTWLRGRRIDGDEPLGQLISRGEA